MHDQSTPRRLRGHVILIVETEPFIVGLQDALEREGAETVGVTDPYSDAGAAQIANFDFSAAVVNNAHRGVSRVLRNVPVLHYGAKTPVPAEIEAVVGALQRTLAVPK